MNVFRSSGDLGDIILSLPTVKHLGGGTYVFVDRPWTKALIPRAHLIEPLLLSQPYIDRVIVGDNASVKVTHDFSTFRQGGLPWGTTLSQLHADWVSPETKKENSYYHKEAWLDIPPTPGYEDKVVIARSPRYHAPNFPWKKIMEFLGAENTVFIGLPGEHQEFAGLTGVNLPRVHTDTLLDVAGIIAGSYTFIGNQSSPNAIAEGLKVRRILEVCHYAPDCLLGGGDVQYVCDGGVTVTHPKSGETLTLPPREPPREIRRDITPPGGWTYTFPDGEVIRSIPFTSCALMVRQRLQDKTLAEAEQMILDQIIAKNPDIGIQPWHLTYAETIRKLKALCPN
jgi:hypothetical protein